HPQGGGGARRAPRRGRGAGGGDDVPRVRPVAPARVPRRGGPLAGVHRPRRGGAAGARARRRARGGVVGGGASPRPPRGVRAGGAIDFDDLVARAVRLLETSGAALAWAQERTRWLSVDEYQDVNAAQVRLVGLLASPNLCAVGDPDQAIYGFRGAEPRHFHAFAGEHAGAATVALAQSYRCPAAVTRAATWLIERSPGRAARPLRPVA